MAATSSKPTISRLDKHDFLRLIVVPAPPGWETAHALMNGCGTWGNCVAA
jgi:hypothetical protein